MNDLGARRVASRAIEDQYYDNLSTYPLLFGDYLLRMRVERSRGELGRWQLKYPSKLDRLENVENYAESENETHIRELVTKLMRVTGSNTIESLRADRKLECYARIVSERKTYLIDDVRVDLDETDFNYKLGEIECVLPSSRTTGENVAKAVKLIDQLTHTLGRRFLLIIIVSFLK